MAGVNSGKGDAHWPDNTPYWMDGSPSTEELRAKAKAAASPEALAFFGDDIEYYDGPIVEADGRLLSEDEQQARRLTHIGGSEIADVFGVGRFKSNLELFYEKTGAKRRLLNDDPKKGIIFSWGHALEPVAAEAMALDFPDWDIRADELVYNHPRFPFLSANVDRIARAEDGGYVLVEIKCPANSFNSESVWGTPDNPLLPEEYELQCRLYMAILGIWRAKVCVMFSPGRVIYRDVYRDLDVEMQLLLAAKEFWERNVQTNIPPDVTVTPENASLAISAIRAFSEKPVESSINISDQEEAAKRYIALTDKKSVLKKEMDILDDNIQAAAAPLMLAMGNHTVGYVDTSEGKTIRISYKPQRGRASTDLKKLEKDFPDAFEACVTRPEEGPRPLKLSYR